MRRTHSSTDRYTHTERTHSNGLNAIQQTILLANKESAVGRQYKTMANGQDIRGHTNDNNIIIIVVVVIIVAI